MAIEPNKDLDKAFMEHVSLWQLLTQNDEECGGPFKPSTLVEAIERCGLTGFDKVGRWKEFLHQKDKDGRQVIEAIEAIEWFDSLLNPVDFAGQEIDVNALELSMSGAHPLLRYGWPKTDLPELEKIEEALCTLKPERSLRKRLNNDQRLIGCLLAMLTGKLGSGGHPDFKSVQDICGFLDVLAQDKSGKFKGLGEGTLKGKFEEALSSVGLG